VRAPADGYTLLLVTAANAINATLYEKLSSNLSRDIAPVAGIIVVPNVMVVNPSVPAKTVPEFIAYAKANPGKINMASGPIGGSSHVSGELFTSVRCGAKARTRLEVKRTSRELVGRVDPCDVRPQARAAGCIAPSRAQAELQFSVVMGQSCALLGVISTIQF
jgi:Tripartite tricarboxylate transporter family receptor